ncbi:MAG TPA: LytTR family transcriptional regulator DNA-binding domain-containing protein [Ferruginibacter sp.]|jgi:two-component system LytT family response regulator|nr:LytTR family transcriptional regulator DNA-binding domain-containing protein [Ferruginibacter sp.]
MTKLKCLFIGKEEKSLQTLFDYASAVSALSIIAKPVNTKKEAQYYSQEFTPDIIFCDATAINSDIDKFLTQKEAKTLIVILTANEEIATTELPYNVFSFISKPVSLDAFLQLIFRINNYLSVDTKKHFSVQNDFVFIKSAYKFYKIKFSDILFCEGMKDYTQVHILNREKPIITLQNLKTFVSKLPPDQFIRVHRSFVVSLSNIDIVSKNEITIGKKDLPIGESYRDQLFNIIQRST